MGKNEINRVSLSDIKQSPYWHDQLEELPRLSVDLPAKVDVLIVGAGYTGLSAAITTARAGRSTAVVDAEGPGFGCSSRNGGQISTSVKPSFDTLAAKFGPERARGIRREGAKALDWVGEFIEGEGLECDFRRVGRFHAAHTPQDYETLARDAEQLRAQDGIESNVIPRAEQRAHLGTDTYFGGVVFPRHCSVHPAKFLRELLRLALAADAQVFDCCRVTQIEQGDNGFRVTTARGVVHARDVIIATNGYTTQLTPWQQRRVIPIGSYIIVTEEVPEELTDRLFPGDRIASDTCKVVYYFRATPDRRRILFGGRVSAAETTPLASAARLRQDMCRIFPELEDVGISYAWSGTVAYSFDELAHIGVHEGLHYAMGYCGSGVSMAPYLGMRAGQKVLGQAEGATAFDGLPFPTRPLYRGKPWFLPAAVGWYRWNDQRKFRKAARMN